MRNLDIIVIHALYGNFHLFISLLYKVSVILVKNLGLKERACHKNLIIQTVQCLSVTLDKMLTL